MQNLGEEARSPQPGERMSNARALCLEGIRDGHAQEAIEKYAGDRYTQHSTPVRDGKQGFIEFFADFRRRNPVREMEILRLFEDGQYVFLQAMQVLNDGEFRYVTADIFDTDDNGKLIEHWDMIAEVPHHLGAGHSLVDGPTQPTDLDKTEQNKVLVRQFLKEVLVSARVDRLSDFLSTTSLIQHNPRIADGINGYANYLGRDKDQDGSVHYNEVHLVIGSGDLVAAMSQATLGEKETAVIDLFRVEDGRIVEHWDVMETITPEATWVNSGKF